MTRAERHAAWLTKRLLAAVEAAVVKAESGRMDEQAEALIRVEGITTQAKIAVWLAQFREVTSGQ